MFSRKYLKSLRSSVKLPGFFQATLRTLHFQGTSLDDELPQEELDPEAPEVCKVLLWRLKLEVCESQVCKFDT